ncbi:MAG: type II toxin-antitoxin system RelE/ParE family toxin [Olsenella sp.]|nr:type II toxin-antitoxin system RelE/ParE family toxin [Olsenella sp.]
MELAWSPAAVDDLEAAVDYIESELASPMAARRLVDSIIEKAQLFADVTGAGTALRALNGIGTGYRYMVCGNWMVFLECDNGRALVVRVLYAKSDYMRTLFGEIDNER